MPIEADVVALFERANPVPDLDVIDVTVTANQRLADALRDDAAPMTVVDDTTATAPSPRRRSWVIPAAAAVLIVVALVAVPSIVGRDETEPSDSVPSTIAPATTTTPPEESAGEPSAAKARQPSSTTMRDLSTSLPWQAFARRAQALR